MDSQRYNSPGGLQYIMDSQKRLHPVLEGLNQRMTQYWRVTGIMDSQRYTSPGGLHDIMDSRDTPVLEGLQYIRDSKSYTSLEGYSI
ncbi:unnamed protein product [Coregonus sp. 'balchen']|nr:unnamed protein product [Coregonus sp. 'balchen']